MEDSSSDKSVPREIGALLTGERLKLRETERAVTPFGGLTVFGEYLNRIDRVGTMGDCALSFGGATVIEGCTFGSPRATKRIALIGDSHAQHWLPAVADIAKKRGWQVHAWTDETPSEETLGALDFAVSTGRAAYECSSTSGASSSDDST